MITKEMVEAAKKSAPQFWRDTDNFDKHVSKILTAAFAAMPGPAVKVKPLVWDELNDGSAFRAYYHLIGSVRVEPYGVCGLWEVLWSMPGQCDKLMPDVFDTPDKAKAAAQADYEARILSALTPAPDLAAENERLMRAALEAAKKVVDVAEHMTSCRSDDEFVWDAQKKIKAALERT